MRPEETEYFGEISPPRADGTSEVRIFGRYWWRTSESVPCVLCNGRSWCLSRPDEVICMRKESDDEVEFKDGNLGYWYPLTEESAATGFERSIEGRDWSWSRAPWQANTPQQVVPRPAASAIASPEIRDRVYRAVLAHLGLSPEHRNALHKRGLSDNAIERAGYATLPRYGRTDVAAQVLTSVPALDTFAGVPGFYLKEPKWALAGAAGLIIPYRDNLSRIVFLQVRSDSDGGYTSFSSPPDRTNDAGAQKFVGGTKAELSGHLSALGSGRRIWITEGGLKADVAAHLSGERFIGVPGVSSWKLACDILDEIKETCDEVIVAFDADKHAPRHQAVLRAEMALVGELRARGYEPLIATWDVNSDFKPKGIDDLLGLKRFPRLVQSSKSDSAPALETSRRSSLKICAPPKYVFEELHGVTVQQAQDDLQLNVALLLLLPSNVKTFQLRSDPFGVGKTSAAVRSLAARSKKWPTVKRANGRVTPKRVAVLVDASKEQGSAGKVLKGATIAQEIGGHAVYLEGRNEKNCARMGEVNAVGAAGQDVMQTVCLSCQARFKSAGARPGQLPPFIDLKGPPLKVCAYLRALQDAESSPVHVMQKAMALNESKRIDQYDVIVVDEAITPSLMQEIVLTKDDVLTWKAQLELQVEAAKVGVKSAVQAKERVAALGKLVALNQHYLLVTLLEHCILNATSSRPLVEGISAAAKAKRVNLRALWLRCQDNWYSEEEGCSYFPHEKPTVQTRTGCIPKRAWRTLLNILLDEVKRPTGDHSAWIVTKKDGALIELRSPRSKLIETLRERVVLNLDSTPDVRLLKLLFPGMLHSGLHVREQKLVIQCTDGIFGSKAQQETLPPRLLKLVKHFASKADIGNVGILARKHTLQKLRWIDFEGERVSGPLLDEKQAVIAGSERFVIGYWGVDERATNRFEDCEHLIISGFYLPPMDVVERGVQAWRRALNLPRPAQNAKANVERPYGYVDEDGLGRSYVVPGHADPDVDEELSRLWSANVRQAVGRLRTTRANVNKLIVIDSAMPAQGLKVDALGTLSKISEKRAAALEAQREANRVTALKRMSELEAALRVVITLHEVTNKRPPSVAELMKMAPPQLKLSEWEARKLLAEAI